MSDDINSTWLGRAAEEADICLNVLFLDGAPGETVSVHAARARPARWARVLCWILGVLVQRNHCDLALTSAPTPKGAAIRAGALILAVLGVLWWIIWRFV